MISSIDSLKTEIYTTGPNASLKAENSKARVNHGSESNDTVQISKEGRDRFEASSEQPAQNPTEEELSPEQKQEVDKLKKRDQEVKAHENAHVAAGSGIVQGGATYQYQRGSDGRMYAVGGEVKIDTSRARTPEDTIRKMQQVKKAALAPSQPSAQDRSVAAQASQIEAEARAELTKETTEETNGNQEGQKTASMPPSGEIAGLPGKTASIGRRIDTVV